MRSALPMMTVAASRTRRSVPNTVNITGITGSVAVSVTGDGSPQDQHQWRRVDAPAATITNGQTLQVRLTSATANITTSSATVTVGTGSATWNVTTLSRSAAGLPDHRRCSAATAATYVGADRRATASMTSDAAS